MTAGPAPTSIRFRLDPLAVVSWPVAEAVVARALPAPLVPLARGGVCHASLVLATMGTARVGRVHLGGGSQAILRTYVDGPAGPGIYQLDLATTISWVAAAGRFNVAVRRDRSLRLTVVGNTLHAAGRGLDVRVETGRAEVDPALVALICAVERGYVRQPLGLGLVTVRRRLLRVEPAVATIGEAHVVDRLEPAGSPSALILETSEWALAVPRLLATRTVVGARASG